MRSPQDILRGTRTIAVVGASANPARPSNQVMAYLLDRGYRVFPVRPHVREVLGIPAVASLTEIEQPIDLVDVFRRAEHTPEIARDAVAAGATALWLQMGIVSPEARVIAEDGGLDYVENACTKVVHRLYLNGGS